MSPLINKGEKIGPFIIDDEIKSGGMASVYKVSSMHNEIYAMKMSRIDRTADRNEYNRQAIRGEAELLSNLDHPRIVKVFSIPADDARHKNIKRYYANAFRIDGRPWYFVMEYLRGDTLHMHIKRNGPLMVSEAANIIGNIGLGLNYLYSRNFSHNDLKAENIVFRSVIEKGKVFDPVLIDFGTAAGAVKIKDEAGTYYVMPPERISIASGIQPPETLIDPLPAEVWSLGVLLYQCLTCKVPFSSNNLRTLSSQVLKDKPLSMRKYNDSIPVEFDEFVIENCLCKEPKYRPTIKEVLHFLSDYGRGAVVAVSA